MTKKYLVTGGAGFIGSNYVNRLLARGENVTIYDNLSRAGAPKNLDWLKKDFGEKSFNVIVADVRDSASIRGSRPRGGCDRSSRGTGSGHHLRNESA